MKKRDFPFTFKYAEEELIKAINDDSYDAIELHLDERCRTVGELKKLLKNFPDDLVLFHQTISKSNKTVAISPLTLSLMCSNKKEYLLFEQHLKDRIDTTFFEDFEVY